MTPELNNILALLTPISLDEMDSVKLMDRSDTKFLFHPNRLPAVMEKAKEFYRVLDISGNRISRYETLYFDSPDFMLYKKHQNGKLNRHKVRFREYTDSRKCYFEIKFKTNKDKTIKKRIKAGNIELAIEGRAADFLSDFANINATAIVPGVRINYSRITLVNKHHNERLTIDLNLRFRNSFPNRPKQNEDNFINIDNFVIAEIKQEKFSYSTDFFSIMKDNRIHPARFSKYCAGVNSLFPEVKYNRFKERILNVHKVQNSIAVVNN